MNRKVFKSCQSADRNSARAIVISTGAQYNKPRIPNLEKFEGQGIYYGATYMESQLCEQEDIVVVGGGNSAGQAAVFLSQTQARYTCWCGQVSCQTQCHAT